MSMQFLDSGFMIALHAVRDQYRALAADYWRSLTTRPQLVTTTFVLVEVVMEQRGLRQALSFDQHFAQAGFECLPAGVGGA